ncbi:hypothetical protein HanPI659440_Chr04g0180701 [Helianthus annuus]|nr:hypothetical protein HanPI659440_Chr04g0180701 [Helianthus annuus]
MVHNQKHPTHNTETHGLREDIDAKTPIGDVKGPTVLERVKEEFEAIVGAVHHRKEDDAAAFTGSKHEKQSSPSDHKGSPSHHKETHGRGDDIDADTPINEVKGPNIFHRAKEEIEAIVGTILSKKESDHDAASPKKD